MLFDFSYLNKLYLVPFIEFHFSVESRTWLVLFVALRRLFYKVKESRHDLIV